MPSARQSVRHHMLAIMIAAIFLVAGHRHHGRGHQDVGRDHLAGSLAVESSVKKVQHPSGGVVKRLLVEEGSHVAKDDLLILMDETVAQANLTAVTKSLWSSRRDEPACRRSADGDADIAFPRQRGRRMTIQPRNPSSRAEHRFFRCARMPTTARSGNCRSNFPARGADRRHAGSAHRQEAGSRADRQRADRRAATWEQRLVSLSRLSALQRDSARLLGERGQLTASIAQAKGKISETELKILQVDQDFPPGDRHRAASPTSGPDMPTRSRSRSPRKTRPRSSRIRALAGRRRARSHRPHPGRRHHGRRDHHDHRARPGQSDRGDPCRAAGDIDQVAERADRAALHQVSTSAPPRRSRARSAGSAPTFRATTRRPRAISWCGLPFHRRS